MWPFKKPGIEDLQKREKRLLVQLKETKGSLTSMMAQKRQYDSRTLQGIYRRAYKLARMHYDSAKTGRTRTDWGITTDTPYNDSKADILKLIARSRNAYDNDPIFSQAIDSIINNTICTGMRPQPMVMKQDNKPNKMINKALADGWRRYNDEWDRREMITFYEAQRLSLTTTAVSGGILSNTVQAVKGKLLPIAKQLIEPDRLQISKDAYHVTKDNLTPKRQILHGVEVDEYGKPVRYWLKGLSKPVSAINMHHAFIHKRPEQHIGIPWGAAVLDSVWDMHQLHEDTLIKSRALADVVWWMNSDTSNAFSKTGDKDDDENRILEELMFLRTPNEPKIIKGDDTITQAVQPLSRMVLHSICSGLGTSYMTVTRDLEGGNFAASRSIIIEERRYYRALQKWFAKAFCQPEWTDFVYWMVFTGQVPGLTIDLYLRNPHKYTQCWWKPESWDWVDPYKDTNADVLMKKNRLATDAELLAKNGKDVESHYKQLQEEKELRKKYDIEEDSANVKQANLFETNTKEGNNA